jgi:hypothetical protein
MTLDRQEEVEALLAKDDGRVGRAWQARREGLSWEEIGERWGHRGKGPTNEGLMFKVLLDAHIPSARTTARLGADLVQRWMNEKSLSPELYADLEAQLIQLKTVASGGEVSARGAQKPRTNSRRHVLLPDGTDRKVWAKARREQAQLRDYLLQGRSEAACELCGRVLPKDLLVAAHIVPRTGLDDEARTQFDRIAMIACRLGCDSLFELGYLTVDETGVIHSRTAEGDVGTELARLDGLRSGAHCADTATAFAEHRRSCFEQWSETPAT